MKLAVLILPATAWCAAPDLDALLSRLARPAPATTPFVEARFSKLLAKPLVVSGELEYLGPDSLARTVKEPFQERTEIKGTTVTVQRGERTRRFSLNRAPELRTLLDSFAALLGGDRSVLERQFTLDLQGDEQAWKLVMTPKDARVKQRIRDITVTGAANEPRCLITTEPDEDASIMLLASAAATKLPDPVQRTGLENECRGPASQ
jgi:Outer membrane lipoprotein carrier protein LolA-like